MSQVKTATLSVLNVIHDIEAEHEPFWLPGVLLRVQTMFDGDVKIAIPLDVAESLAERILSLVQDHQLASGAKQ